MNTLVQDVRYALRMFVRNPGFSTVAVVTLALGIGANTAIFSVVNSVLLRPFAFKDPDRLVMIWETQLQRGLPFMFASPPNYADWREQSQSFEDMAAFSQRELFVTRDGEAERVRATQVSASLFPLLGVPPLLGRTFIPEEDRQGARNTVVMSHAMWQSAYGGDPSAVGRTITINSEAFEVIGVMPSDFNFPPPIALEGRAPAEPSHLWVPIARDLKSISRGAHFMMVSGRLKDGVTLEAARAELTTLASRIERANPQTNAGWSITLVPFDQQVLGQVRPALLVLLGAVAFVLLIACVNVANLLLARGSVRQREFAIRAALGAGWGRIARQVLTESMLLAIAGGLAGLGLAALGLRFLIGLAPANVPRLDEVSIDGGVVLFTLLASLVTGVVFGVAPALGTFSAGLSETLKEGGRGSSGGRARLQNALVVAEVALSLVLLAGAGLLFRSFLSLQGVDPGFKASRVVTMQVSLPRSKYAEDPQRATGFLEIRRRVGELPDVEAVGLVLETPLASDRQGTSFTVEGEPPPLPSDNRQTNFSFVSPGYFTAMGVPMLKGRDILDRDAQDTAAVILINEAFARRYFPNEEALSKRLFVGFKTQTSREVVGIVGSVRFSSLDQEAGPCVYVPYAQFPDARTMTLVAKTRNEPLAAVAGIRQQVRAVEPEAAIFEMQTLDEVLHDSVAQPRFAAVLLVAFASTALMLGAVGIYGVMSYSVAQRTRELGVRMALGAAASDIFRLVIGQGMMLAMIGVGIGMLATWWLTRFVAGMLYEVSPFDPLTLGAITVLLGLVAMFACYIPARRAAAVDPMVALRYE